MERSSKLPLKEILIAAATTAVVYEASKTAFTSGVRHEMLERDECCTVCGSREHLHASHFNHDKSRPEYNNPNNGQMLCVEHHLEDHIERAGQNGLAPDANDWAIDRLTERLDKIREEVIQRETRELATLGY